MSSFFSFLVFYLHNTVGLKPQVPVSCSGSVTIKSLSGVDCFREGEPCWTCCTVDIDSENFVSVQYLLNILLYKLYNMSFTFKMIIIALFIVYSLFKYLFSLF